MLFFALCAKRLAIAMLTTSAGMYFGFAGAAFDFFEVSK